MIVSIADVFSYLSVACLSGGPERRAEGLEGSQGVPEQWF